MISVLHRRFGAAGLGNQVLLFTCQRREELLLRELGIDYYRIDIGN